MRLVHFCNVLSTVVVWSECLVRGIAFVTILDQFSFAALSIQPSLHESLPLLFAMLGNTERMPELLCLFRDLVDARSSSCPEYYPC